MEHVNRNLPKEIVNRVEEGLVSKGWPLAMLVMRTVLFFVIGFLMISIFSLMGMDAWKIVIRWWPFQVIAVNLVCFLILTLLVRKEGIHFIDLINYQKGYLKKFLKKDVLLNLSLLPIALILGGGGLYGSSFLIFGTMPPDTMFKPLPFWAALFSLIIFPISNALVETTTYIGYSLPRLEVTLRNKWLPLVLAALALSVQHIAFPLFLDWRFMLWRFISFIPTAFLVGFVYMRIRRLIPLLAGHYFMDLQLVITVFIISLESI